MKTGSHCVFLTYFCSGRNAAVTAAKQGSDPSNSQLLLLGRLGTLMHADQGQAAAEETPASASPISNKQKRRQQQQLQQQLQGALMHADLGQSAAEETPASASPSTPSNKQMKRRQQQQQQQLQGLTGYARAPDLQTISLPLPRITRIVVPADQKYDSSQSGTDEGGEACPHSFNDLPLASAYSSQYPVNRSYRGMMSSVHNNSSHLTSSLQQEQRSTGVRNYYFPLVDDVDCSIWADSSLNHNLAAQPMQYNSAFTFAYFARQPSLLGTGIPRMPFDSNSILEEDHGFQEEGRPNQLYNVQPSMHQRGPITETTTGPSGHDNFAWLASDPPVGDIDDLFDPELLSMLEEASSHMGNTVVNDGSTSNAYAGGRSEVADDTPTLRDAYAESFTKLETILR
ncbi:hypothetical protein CEUSTIGMA_g5306.t1 [Chlamydomonas eustigma]|uniref:Uncharacterized protein n=1 Tax=Chlamydomonas eustigma TaxID=1157962 RepID=A0A250X456_9CHLO|nr:hypothetical protein CEUSTIGMA_g5306.t1 [Chlamydomonas eustigma]|eukprot:GAX77864.1 hypothetical protein CEUSTIGMA_g5306.t1 [Chlamydomonas eustigma]